MSRVLCGYTYLQVSYKVHLLSMKARQAQEGTQVPETEDRENRAETTEQASHGWGGNLKAWLIMGVVIYRYGYL